MVSIVMATYNRAATIKRAVDSVVAQTYADWELIVVDDGSTDGTRQVLQEFKDSRIRILTHSENRGVCAAKNTGLDHVRGEWFTLLDSDDEMMPDALQAMLECAECTGATAVTCRCMDSSTGQLVGSGPVANGRLSPRATAKCRGEFWGLTQTWLLGDLRFDERLPGIDAHVWLQINRKSRRYYLHRALRIYHTEGADRVTKSKGGASLSQKAHMYVILAENKAYFRELRRVDPAEYCRLQARVCAARVARILIRSDRNARVTPC